MNLHKFVQSTCFMLLIAIVISGCTSKEPLEGSLDLSTPEKTFDLFINLVRINDFDTISKISSQKQANVTNDRIALMHAAVNSTGVNLSEIIFGVMPQELIVKINPQHSGYTNLVERKTYNKLYNIDYDVGSRTYSTYFVLEDNDWRITWDWDKYVTQFIPLTD